MIIVGIDPGQSGAIVSIDGEFASFVPMPLRNDGTKDVCFEELYETLLYIKEHGDTHIFLERAMPMAMGSKHAFNYGRGFAAIELAVISLKVPVTYVEASKWQKIIFDGIDSRLKPKERALIAVQRLSPTTVDRIPKNKKGRLHDGIVDALLIAEYGKRVLGICDTIRI